MNYLTDIPADQIRGKYVLVRAGLDVPLDEHGEVADLFRVERAAATLHHLREYGAKTIILSHIGRDPSASNEPVARALRTHVPVFYVRDILGREARDARATMKDGDVLLLENLRTDPREAANDADFARDLAALGDFYVDDAFSVAHRAHASLVGIPRHLPSYAGILMREEVDRLSMARTPEHPSLAILGGAKFETKEPLIKSLLEVYDHVLVAGALSNDVFKARGLAVGTSLVSEYTPDASVLSNPKFAVPVDVTVEGADMHVGTKRSDAVASTERIVDIGPDTLSALAPLIADAKFILWNGPTGLYERGFTIWTERIAELIAHSSATAVIGGGDTIAAIQEAHVHVGGNTFLSTGGGAMIEYLLQGSLPGIDALNGAA